MASMPANFLRNSPRPHEIQPAIIRIHIQTYRNSYNLDRLSSLVEAIKKYPHGDVNLNLFSFPFEN